MFNSFFFPAMLFIVFLYLPYENGICSRRHHPPTLNSKILYLILSHCTVPHRSGISPTFHTILSSKNNTEMSFSPVILIVPFFSLFLFTRFIAVLDIYTTWVTSLVIINCFPLLRVFHVYNSTPLPCTSSPRVHQISMSILNPTTVNMLV